MGGVVARLALTSYLLYIYVYVYTGPGGGGLYTSECACARVWVCGCVCMSERAVGWGWGESRRKLNFAEIIRILLTATDVLYTHTHTYIKCFGRSPDVTRVGFTHTHTYTHNISVYKSTQTRRRGECNYVLLLDPRISVWVRPTNSYTLIYYYILHRIFSYTHVYKMVGEVYDSSSPPLRIRRIYT